MGHTAERSTVADVTSLGCLIGVVSFEKQMTSRVGWVCAPILIQSARVEIKCQSDPTGQVGPSKAKYATLKITTGLKESFPTGVKDSFTGLKVSFARLKESF